MTNISWPTESTNPHSVVAIADRIATDLITQAEQFYALETEDGDTQWERLLQEASLAQRAANLAWWGAAEVPYARTQVPSHRFVGSGEGHRAADSGVSVEEIGRRVAGYWYDTMMARGSNVARGQRNWNAAFAAYSTCHDGAWERRRRHPWTTSHRAADSGEGAKGRRSRVMPEQTDTDANKPCPVCGGVKSHAAACPVPVLGGPKGTNRA